MDTIERLHIALESRAYQARIVPIQHRDALKQESELDES